MQDRPTAAELLEAIEEFLRERSAADTDRYYKFQFLVAANSLAILRREWDLEEANLRAEWERLNRLLGARALPPDGHAMRAELLERNDGLCDRIGAGEFDASDRETLLIDHLIATTREKLRITSPPQADEPA